MHATQARVAASSTGKFVPPRLIRAIDGPRRQDLGARLQPPFFTEYIGRRVDSTMILDDAEVTKVGT